MRSIEIQFKEILDSYKIIYDKMFIKNIEIIKRNMQLSRIF